MTTSTPTTALVITADSKGRTSTDTRDRLDTPRDWDALLHNLRSENERQYCPTTYKVYAVNSRNGEPTIKHLTRCAQCDTYKVPGQRHRHTAKRAPKASDVLTCNLDWAKWTGDLTDDSMFHASRCDPRWANKECGQVVRVTSVRIVEGFGPFEYDGVSYDGQPDRTVVTYSVELTGDWSDQDDKRTWLHGKQPDAGTHEMDLDEWRVNFSEHCWVA
jgi:hypothetical protein